MSVVRDTDTVYVEIWAWLVSLLVVGTVVVFLPIPRLVALLVVFGVASVKAALVVRNYMHLKGEHLMIYLIAAIPLLLILIMTIALLPDIAFHR